MLISKNLLPLLSRDKRIIIFGSRGPRERVYAESREVLLELCKKFSITEIVDVGPPLGIILEPINGIQIKELGILSAEKISGLLSNSLIGFLNYPTEYLAKSGIFAAFCSHRIFPVAAWYINQKIDLVEENIHYWTGKNKPYSISENLNEAQVIADNALSWYQEHRLSVHAQSFFETI